MELNPAVYGLLKGLLTVIAWAVINALVAFFSDPANLNGVLNPALSAIIVAVVSALEQNLATKQGKPLFGAARLK